LLEQIEGAAQLAHVAAEIADREQVALARDHHLVLRLRQRLGADLHRRLHERPDFAAQALELALDALAHLLDRHAGVMRVQEVGAFDELLLGVIRVGEQHAVLHIAVGCDDDHQDAPLRQAQEFDVAKHRAAPRRYHHTHKMAQVAQQLRRTRNHLVRLVGRQLRRTQLLALHGEHGVHEQAVAARGGNAAGRCVRAGDQAQLFEVGHHVADGGGRQFQATGARQCARAYRLAVGDVAFDERFQQLPGAFIEHAIF